MAERFSLVEQATAKLAMANQVDDVRDIAFGYFRSFDVPMVSYHHLPPIGATDQGILQLSTEGFPEGAVQRYIREKLFLIDPVPAYAQKTVRPFRWATISKLTKLRPEQKSLMAEFVNAGLIDGYAFQAFGPGGRNGVFGLGFRQAGRRFEPEALRQIHGVCQAAHLRICELIENNLPKAVRLSRRESEVLEWVARGKSNIDIATIMGVSAHTVDAYLRRIFMKLGTTDRVTAAIRGVRSGIITGVV